jgi:NAD(P)-dependent dehydrogenase (short-subunit alcohol dehydrogenase family)
LDASLFLSSKTVAVIIRINNGVVEMAEERAIRSYQDAVAIITGGASGIGRALAVELARRGAEVILADLQLELAEEAAAEIRDAGGRALAAEVDVRSSGAMAELINDTVENSGRLDYLFNNAGIGIIGKACDHAVDDWDYIVGVNLHGVVNGIQVAYPLMIEQGFGHIVNTASIAGLCPSPGLVSYAATKHAVVGLSTSLRLEAEAHGVRVSVLCPGVIQTAILDGGKYGRDRVGINPELLKDLWQRLRPMPADAFAKKTLDAVAANKPLIIVPSWWRLAWWIQRFSPRLSLFVARKAYQDLQKRVDSFEEKKEGDKCVKL